MTYRRRARQRTYTASSLRSAAGTIGPIDRESEIMVLTKGQFSLSDAILHALGTTGPARIDIATWSAAGAAIDEAREMIDDGRILGMRWIIDRSFPARQPAYCEALLAAFGRNAIRVTRTNAKFVVIHNAEWTVTIRTSANLNKNPRCEYLEISTDPELGAWFLAFVDDIFSSHGPELLGGPTRPIDTAFANLKIGERGLVDDIKSDLDPLSVAIDDAWKRMGEL